MYTLESLARYVAKVGEEEVKQHLRNLSVENPANAEFYQGALSWMGAIDSYGKIV